MSVFFASFFLRLSASQERTSENSGLAKFAFWAFCELRLYGVLRSSPYSPQGPAIHHLVKILQLRDAPSLPLWCHGGRRSFKHKVEALNPALRKLGTQEGLGSQWCNRLPFIPQEVGGERGCGRGMCFPPPT